MEKFQFSMPTQIFAERDVVRKTAGTWVVGRKALIVTGAHSAQASGALADVLAGLEQCEVASVVYDGVRANPDAEQVYAGAAVAQAEGCDFVVAIGGGSPMDAAKAIAWVVAAEVAREEFFLRQPLPTEKVLPIVAIPTTCGTGSEVTPYAIITDTEAQTKVNVMGKHFFPQFALLDAKYLEALPGDVIADTAMDALSHAIESICSPRSTRLTRAMCCEVMTILVPELVRLAHGVFVNRTALHYASMLAGMAIAQTGTCLVHAMGYPLTIRKGVPHGRANGILLPGYLKYIEEVCPELAEQILQAMGLASPDELMGLVDALLDTMGVPRPELTEAELEAFAQEPLRLTVCKRFRTLPSVEQVIDIYRYGC